MSNTVEALVLLPDVENTGVFENIEVEQHRTRIVLGYTGGF